MVGIVSLIVKMLSYALVFYLVLVFTLFKLCL